MGTHCIPIAGFFLYRRIKYFDTTSLIILETISLNKQVIQMKIKLLLLAGLMFTGSLFSQGVERIDWGYYFSNALYTKWSPVGTTVPGTPASVGLKKQFGEFVGTTTSTGIDTAKAGSVFINGPNYSQYQKYVYSTKYSQHERITYKVNFRLKKGQVIGGGDDVCYLQIVKKTPFDSVLLNSKLVTQQMLTETFKDYILVYDYDFPPLATLGVSDLISQQAAFTPEGNIYDINTKIEFRIVWLGNTELILDYIEVYDDEIYETYFIENIAHRDRLLKDYVAELNSSRPDQTFFLTMYKPHTIDSYHPIRTVQNLLDSLNSPVKFLSKK